MPAKTSRPKSEHPIVAQIFFHFGHFGLGREAGGGGDGSDNGALPFAPFGLWHLGQNASPLRRVPQLLQYWFMGDVLLDWELVVASRLKI